MLDGMMKAQMGLEYMMIFASSAAIVVYVLAISVAIGAGGTTHNLGALAPVGPSCYISANMDCIGASASSSTGNFVVEFVNNAGAVLKLPPNSFGVRFRSSLTEFLGSCTPSTAPVNARVTCTVNIPMGQSNSIKRGQFLSPAFTIGYEGCLYNSCISELNSTGSATLHAN